MDEIKTLSHNGVIFPKEYNYHKLKLKNEFLSPLAEEMLYNYAFKNDVNEKFNNNFYECLKDELTDSQLLLKFPDDFKNILLKLKELKPELTKEEKEEKKKEMEKLKKKYGFATVNGKKEPLGNYFIEPPGIFMGRGDSPYLGLWKYRVYPEDVIINVINSEPPKPPKGRSWKEITNKNVSYIACYNIKVGKNNYIRKEVRFGNASSIINESDNQKFLKSENLLNHWDEVQNKIKNDLEKNECALIAWLIQYTSIRIGAEETENGVVGASTLKIENIKIVNDDEFNLNFIGKDSINYDQNFKVNKYIIKALKKCMKGKNKNDKLFNVNYNNVNDYLNEVLEGLTAKVFRTAWAEKLLKENYKPNEIKKTWPKDYKILKLKMLILEVSLKLNHKKTTKKILNDELKKIQERIDNLKKKKLTSKQEWKIKTLELKLKFVNLGFGFNLNTALTNYINPKIIVEICKDKAIPIDGIYSKQLIKRFNL